MSQNPFAAPAAPSAGIQWKDLNGALLLIEPAGIESGIPTTYGEAEAVRADVHVLDGAQGGQEYADTLVFPTILRSQLKSRIGQKVLGRLSQGQAKAGQSPPWILAEATEQDVAKGTAFLSGSLNAPAAPAATEAEPPF